MIRIASSLSCLVAAAALTVASGACTSATSAADAGAATDGSTSTGADGSRGEAGAYPCPNAPELRDTFTPSAADGLKVTFKLAVGWNATAPVAGETSDRIKLVRYSQPFSNPAGGRYPGRAFRLDVEQLGPFPNEGFPFADGTGDYVFGTGFSALGEANEQSLDVVAGSMTLGGETVKINRQVGKDQARFRVKLVAGEQAYAIGVRAYVVETEPVVLLDRDAVCTPAFDTLGLAVTKSLVVSP